MFVPTSQIVMWNISSLFTFSMGCSICFGNFQFSVEFCQIIAGILAETYGQVLVTTPALFQNCQWTLGRWPITKVQGATPVVSFSTSLKHHMTIGRTLCQSLGCSIANLPMVALTFPTALSARPVEDGWHGLLKRGEQPIRLSNSLVNWLVKFVPRSDEI